MKKVIYLLAGIIALAACKGSIKDGKIPSQYISQAKPYAGVYHGEFEGRQMDLHLNLLDDGTVQMSVLDLNGNNQLIDQCTSQVGKLTAVSGDSDRQILKSLSFAFNAGTCKIAGETVDLVFQDQNSLKVWIVKTVRVDRGPGETTCIEWARDLREPRCHIMPGPAIRTPTAYLTGSFTK